MGLVQIVIQASYNYNTNNMQIKEMGACTMVLRPKPPKPSISAWPPHAKGGKLEPPMPVMEWAAPQQTSTPTEEGAPL